MSEKPLDLYAQAGVDIDASDRLIPRIRQLAERTQEGLPFGARVLGGVGGFAGALGLPLPAPGLVSPDDQGDLVLLGAADGVGTKLELALRYNAPATIGKDVVAMCINDLLCAGGTPLFFLDYIACGKIDAAFISEVIAAISQACCDSRCALIGGETAEMPGVYEPQGFDIAGFAVGVAKEGDLLKPRGEPGDALIALASSGAHSNGYSLIRKLLAQQPELAQETIEGRGLIDCLLAPTNIYSKAITALRSEVKLHGLAHITGGGITDNLPRVLPDNVEAELDNEALQLPPLFALLQQAGGIGDADMRRFFNCGVGMIAVVAASDASRTVEVLTAAGERARVIGCLRRK